MAAEKQPIPVGSFRATAIGTYDQATWQNVFYGVVDTFDPVHLQDVAALVADGVAQLYGSSHLTPHLVGDWQLQTTRVVFRDTSSSVYRATLADVVNGSVGTTGQTANTCYLINWQTGDPRKGGKPRTYVCGVPDGVIVGSTDVDATARTAMNTALVAWINDNLTRAHGTAHGLIFGEMSFRDHKAWRDTPIFYPFIAGTLSQFVATQRRRVDRRRS